MVFAPIPGALTDGRSTRSVALADVDGDGDLDAVLVASNNAGNRVLHNDGTGTFTAAATPLPHPGATAGMSSRPTSTATAIRTC
jgi:hypothetical protein